MAHSTNAAPSTVSRSSVVDATRGPPPLSAAIPSITEEIRRRRGGETSWSTISSTPSSARARAPYTIGVRNPPPPRMATFTEPELGTGGGGRLCAVPPVLLRHLSQPPVHAAVGVAGRQVPLGHLAHERVVGVDHVGHGALGHLRDQLVRVERIQASLAHPHAQVPLRDAEGVFQ